jgi:hypothetical protein
MIQRGSDTSFTNLWSLLLYLQSLLHYIENEIRNDLFLSISDLSQLINTSLLTSGSETLGYADNCLIFYSVFRFTNTRNKKNTILSYNIAENSKRVKINEEKVCVCVCLDAGWCLVSTLND